jgi:hypothetical protein
VSHPSLIAKTLDRLRPFRHTAIVFVERAVLSVQSKAHHTADVTASAAPAV